MSTLPEPSRENVRLPPLTALETASGMIFGPDVVGSLHHADSRSSPRETLDEILVPALERRPCLVAFSGGRDSSAVLAAATDLARRTGLDDPVPITMRFAAHPRTWEAEWQESLVEHLGLGSWEIHEVSTEFDAVGDLAGQLLRRHGLFWPANAHTMVPWLYAAKGGTLVTGNGGDELFTPWASRRLDLIRHGRARPTRAELKFVALSFMPRAVRRRVWRARPPVRLAWLSDEGSRQLSMALAERWSERDPPWVEAIQRTVQRRYLRLARAAFEAFASSAGCQLVEPFLDPRFVGAVGRASPPKGYESRAAALEAHFGDLLPSETISRSTKATFTEAFWGPACRAFAARWDGSGLDHELVNADRLRSEWSKETPDFRSITALQAAWLAHNGHD